MSTAGRPSTAADFDRGIIPRDLAHSRCMEQCMVADLSAGLGTSIQIGMVSKSPKSQVQSQRYRWKDTGEFCQNQGSAKHTAILVHDLNLLVVLHGARSEYRYCTEFNGQKIAV